MSVVERFLRNRYFLVGALILAAGVLTAAVVFITASDGETLPDDAFSGGTVYVVPFEDSKMYRHELERFGGKAAVMADDLNRWFSSLWHGKRLAVTIGVLAFLVSLGFFRAGKNDQESTENKHTR